MSQFSIDKGIARPYFPNMLLGDKTALVYGAGGSVGSAVTRAFAREGARVVLAGRTRAKLEETAERVRAEGGRAEIEPVDALDEAAVPSHFDRVTKAYGPVGIMFNAISWGNTQGMALADSPYHFYADHVHNALKTWFLTGTVAARHMAANGGGVILGITAFVGRFPAGMMGGFGVACIAVETFLRQLGIENGSAGVRCAWVRSAGSSDAPGVVEALKLRARESGRTLDAVLAEMGQAAALKRMPLLAEIADAAVMLASDYCRSMTATFANATCGAQVE